jgi:DNA-binding response OmpR family regulator
MGNMASLPRVLLVEDDKNVSDTLVLALKNDFVIDVVRFGKTAIYKSDLTDYDSIILDLNLPDISGIDVCINIRNRGLKAPILVLSGVSDVKSKVKLLDLGASDYLVKPFALGELQARLKALSRRNRAPAKKTASLSAFNVKLDREQLLVFRNNQLIDLRRKEFDILACLMENTNKVISRAELIASVWPEEDNLWTNALDVHINHLRDKLDKPFDEPLIHTVHGRGFKFTQLKVKQLHE